MVFHSLLTTLLVLVAAHGEILCARSAEVTPLLPKFQTHDPCVGSVLLQGISYRCADPNNFDELMRNFLADLSSNGRKACASFCRARGSGCSGHFEAPSRCGWSLPRSEILQGGRGAPCDNSCGGTAFVYCSIYHASYLSLDEKLFLDQKPNCYCERDTTHSGGS